MDRQEQIILALQRGSEGTPTPGGGGGAGVMGVANSGGMMILQQQIRLLEVSESNAFICLLNDTGLRATL